MLDALTWRLNAPLLMVDALRASHAQLKNPVLSCKITLIAEVADLAV